jgi:hypothetical protein
LLSQPLRLKISSFTSSLLHIKHRQREYGRNLTGVHLDILRVIETPGATVIQGQTSPPICVDIWGGLSGGFHHKPTQQAASV